MRPVGRVINTRRSSPGRVHGGSRRTLLAASLSTFIVWSSVSCARSPERVTAGRCNQATANPVVTLDLPGRPFQAVPSADGCFVFVSLAGPVEPGDPRRPPEPGAAKGGVALVSREEGSPSLRSVTPLEGSPYGMALTHDGRLLVVAGDDRMAFVDTARLVTSPNDAVVGYLDDAPLAGRIYASITRDDHWLFVSDESSRSISVVNLEKARTSGFDNSSVVGQIPVGRAPIALTFSSDDQLLYTTSQEAPPTSGWPPMCRPPGSEVARQGASFPEGAIIVIDVARATHDPINSVLAMIPAGCNPVRLITSPSGDVAYVSARTDNVVLAFDTRRLLSDPAHARIDRIPVGDGPVGLALLDDGSRLVVTNSNRYGNSDAPQSLTVIDTTKMGAGANAVLGTVPVGVFPRELSVTSDQRTLLLTNFGSKTLAIMDAARLPLKARSR